MTEVTEVTKVTRAGVHALRQWIRCSQCALSFLIYVTSVTFLTSTASAAEKPFAAPQVAEHAPVASAGSLAQVTLSLLLVLAAVFAAAWLVRRLRGFGKFGSNAIQIIADAPLGTKERAVLIQVGKQQLLLGVAPGQVNMLHVLAENVDMERRVAAIAEPTAPGQVDFKSVLKRSLGL